MDAMHTQHDTATVVTGAGGDYVLTVKANQKSLYAHLKALPWASVPAATRTDRGHGRRATRTIKVVDVPGLDRVQRSRAGRPTAAHRHHARADGPSRSST